MPFAKDFLHPENRHHKLPAEEKRLVPHSNSYFMDIKCLGCYRFTIVCAGCSTILYQPIGGKALLLLEGAVLSMGGSPGSDLPRISGKSLLHCWK